MLWVVGSLTLAAIIAPWIYRGGMGLAAMTASQDMPALVEWLGAACGRAKFGRFFDRSLLLAALVLLPLLIRRIRRLGGAAEGSGGIDMGGALGWKNTAAQVVTGCCIAGGVLWGLGALLEAAGAFQASPKAPGLAAILPKLLVTAVVAALMEEALFRGLLLGLWLRLARPWLAVVGTSLLFAFLHFLKPPAGMVIAEPGHWLAGFDLLGGILHHFTDPEFFVTDFATLLAVGLILGWARWRSGALAFSIGLHAGWILAFQGFNKLYDDTAGHALRPWAVGESLRSGLLPLLALGLTAVICHFALRAFPRARSRA